MPELPEVERFRALLSPLLHQTVRLKLLAPHRGVDIDDDDDPIEFQCRAVQRQGKQLCLESSERTLCLHMGMTGSIRVRGKPTNWGHTDAPLIPEEEEWPPRFAYLSITNVDDPSYIACFCDPRKFGKVYFVDSSAKILDELAPDALKCEISSAMVERLAHQRLSVKALLLDQKRIVSGVGNWVADEVLYQTNIHPEQSYLTVKEARAILEKLQDILQTAVGCLNADSAYPETWLFGHRWTKKSSSKDFYQRPIRFVTVGGRTSAVVRDQKLYQRQGEKSSRKPRAPENQKPKIKQESTKKRSADELQQFRRSPRLTR